MVSEGRGLAKFFHDLAINLDGAVNRGHKQTDVIIMDFAKAFDKVIHRRLLYNIGIKHGFSCINIRQVPWEVLKTEAEGCGFQHLPRDLANVNALKNHARSLLLHNKLKTFATFRVIFCTILFRLFTDVSRT